MNKYRKIIMEIARREGTSPKEVCLKIQEAINAGLQNPNLSVQEEWKKIHSKYGTPKLEEIIEYCVENITYKNGH